MEITGKKVVVYRSLLVVYFLNELGSKATESEEWIGSGEAVEKFEEAITTNILGEENRKRHQLALNAY